MAHSDSTLKYIQAAVTRLKERGFFPNGYAFRPTQKDALDAYHEYLFSNIPHEQKLRGFFELPTGTGKTALFLAIVNEAHIAAKEEGNTLKTMIVVPTLTLMDQVQGDVAMWASDYKMQVGLYGDNKKDLGKELTIITYASWASLVDAGLLDSSKVNILISDEAHRGTSDRRISAIFNAFANGTLHLAFTATARFDETKSVEQTHGREIFSRRIADSIRLGELAAYIQTQLHIIRVDPSTLEKKDLEMSSAILAGMRQEAWMQQTQQLFRDGRDEHTGDLLSDNQAGFFVNSIDMSDLMEQRLGNDPVLQARAREKGCTGVAVAIHSKLSERERKRRLKAFENGEYMAAISDEQMKEGFDHPPLKTIFDYPRGSLVDKAQIIGRGCRQYFNPSKDGRSEGCTFVDTIVYVGSNDPEKEEKLRSAAMRQAILAWTVLEDVMIFSPDKLTEEPSIRRERRERGKPVYGLQVESFTSLEDLNILFAEDRVLKKADHVEMTDAMRIELREQMDRTGYGAIGLLEANPDLKEIVTAPMISAWVSPRKHMKAVQGAIWNEVMSTYAALPDSPKIPITPEMRAALVAEMDRTGAGAYKFLSINTELQEIVTGAIIISWINPESTTVNVSSLVYDAVMAAYAVLPDNEMIPLTLEMRASLREEIERTGMSGQRFLNAYPDLQASLSIGDITAWSSAKGRVKNVSGDIWAKVMRAYASLPDSEYIPLTEDMKKDIRAQVDRTGIGPVALGGAFPDMKQYSGLVKVWISATSPQKSALKTAWDKVISKYKELPDRDNVVPLTQEIRAQIKAEMIRTGISQKKFLDINPDLKIVLTVPAMRAWLSPGSTTKNIHENTLKKVLTAYRSLPNSRLS